MICENAQQNMVLAQYSELPDELQFPLEQHISSCENCRREWKALQVLDEELSLSPVIEPSPNLLAASRMQLDEILDAMPPRSLVARFSANFFRWVGTMQSAPALTTLLIGTGFLGGNMLTRYQIAHTPVIPGVVTLSNASNGVIASVSGITATPNSDVVEVKYNRLIPESIQGPMSDPKIRELLMLGTKLATNNIVHGDSVSLLAHYCLSSHGCDDGPVDGSSSEFRTALLRSLRSDKSANVRMAALEGLQAFVARDSSVRDAVLVSIMQDPNAGVRTRAIALLEPVQADSSVRQVLRTVSSQDDNPAIRDASFQVLQGTANIQ